MYMPTFNMNKDSLEADINGTYAGVDGDPTHGTPYDDYVATYTVGDQVDGSEIYDADSNDVDEIADGTAVEGTNYVSISNTHTAKETLDATLISMEAWINDYNSEAGPYWVYDEDGWVYWAQAIEPGTATGLLPVSYTHLTLPTMAVV